VMRRLIPKSKYWEMGPCLQLGIWGGPQRRESGR
jgi:hypothetical protein